MTEPTCLDDFVARHKQNLRYEGVSPGGVKAHLPCPFCAAADFMVFNVMYAETAFAVGGTCAECGRSMRAEVVSSRGAVSLEFVQTGGSAPPAFLLFKPRRVDLGPAP